MAAPRRTWLLQAACTLLLLVGVQQADASKRSKRVLAQRRAEVWQARASARRNLLQDAAASPAPAGEPLPTPADALNVCSLETLRMATKCTERKKVFYEGEEPDEECCQRMSSYYSNASKMPTRNCWCDAAVWAREQELELKTYISFGAFFDGCTAANHTVGDEVIAYYQDGAGPCAGMPAGEMEEEAHEEETPAYPPQRSFGKWLREGLPENPYVLFCFIVAIPSLVGFNIMLWPFVFHAVLTVVELPQKRAAKKAY